MKDIKDLIPFCVPTEGLSDAQGDELIEKLVAAGADECESCDTDEYYYFGVDSWNNTVNWNELESFDCDEANPNNVTIVPYSEIDAFLGVEAPASTDTSSTPVVSVPAQPDEVIITPEDSYLPEDEDASTDSVDTPTACDVIETLCVMSQGSYSLHFESGECNVEFSDGTYCVKNETELEQLIEAHNFLEERAV